MACMALSSCETAEQEAASHRADPVRQQHIGQRVEQMLFESRQVKPIFSTKQRVQKYEREELNKFAASVPGGNFIFGGYPSFWIEFKKTEIRINDQIRGDFAPVFNVTYEVTMKAADNGSVISRAEFSDICIESEALLTHPTRCRILRPYVLRKALEQL